MKKDQKKSIEETQKALFLIALREFKQNNKGCANVLDYIEKQYGGNKKYYCKVARSCGYMVMKRGGKYFIEV